MSMGHIMQCVCPGPGSLCEVTFNLLSIYFPCLMLFVVLMRWFGVEKRTTRFLWLTT